ncbi:DUF3097 domain-containing protein [Georgenia sp. Z1491]|uniref:DUF3097 domain-containing protein n=1 Tax=Georgenia sp. Z1491 TaxID=3416707 RepID=UPI003CE8A1BA
MTDRYGPDVLASPRPDPRRRPVTRDVPAERGLVVEDVETGFVGAITRIEKSGGMHLVTLEDRLGRRRSFTLGPGFWIDGAPVRLVPPQVSAAQARPDVARTAGGRNLTASGSLKVEGGRARVARASRIWVEGRHDAELVERVWGDDLRVEGVVVEQLEGADHLADVLAAFRPGPARRAGVLLDHLVAGSKETRIVDDARRRLGGAAQHVLVLGHPYVDVWQAVRPERVGLTEWPHVPRGTDIKVGTLRALGWPHADQGDVARGWQRILGSVRTYADLSPQLLGRVEELIDFVTGVPE